MRELTEKRTLHSKTHDLGNGQHRLVASMIPMHYEEAGVLHDIDMTIQNGVVNSGIYKVELLADKIGFKAIDRASGKAITVSLGKLGGHNVSYSAPTIDGNKVTWTAVRTGTDVEFIFNPHQVNIFRVLQNAQAEKSAHWDIEEELGEKVIKMNTRVVGRDAAKKETKHTVLITPPEETPNRKRYTIHDTFESKVFNRDRRTRVKTESDEVSYPVRIDPTVSVSITNTADDGYSFKQRLASVTIASSFVVSPTNDFLSSQNNFESRVFYRFLGITIPQSATINSAELKPYISNKGADLIANVEARKVNNPSAPTNVAGVFSPGTLASNNVNKTFTTASGSFSTINILSIAQELVNAFDYSNEAMIFFIKPVAPPFSGNAVSFEDFSNAGSNPAQLVIDYTAGGGSAIKTWDGLADASTKTWDGLDRASIKTFNGLA